MTIDARCYEDRSYWLLVQERVGAAHVDRARFHPCTKNWAGGCRGQVGYGWARFNKSPGEWVTWCGPGFPYVSMPPGDTWLATMHAWRDEKMAKYPNPCVAMGSHGVE